MAGTQAGGRAAANTNKRRYGADFYAKIGAKGGRNGNTGGFAQAIYCTKSGCTFESYLSPHLIRECAGSRGGQVSRRGINTHKPDCPCFGCVQRRNRKFEERQ